MLMKKNTRAVMTRKKATIHTPTVLTLLIHMIKATITSGMLFLYVAGGALIMLLDYNRVALDIPIVLVFGPLILLVLVNGSSAWQEDWNEYHLKLADRRHQDMGKRYSHNH